jgi:hypothetical protein
LVDDTILKGFPDFGIKFLEVTEDQGFIFTCFHTGWDFVLGQSLNTEITLLDDSPNPGGIL